MHAHLTELDVVVMDLFNRKSKLAFGMPGRPSASASASSSTAAHQDCASSSIQEDQDEHVMELEDELEESTAFLQKTRTKNSAQTERKGCFCCCYDTSTETNCPDKQKQSVLGRKPLSPAEKSTSTRFIQFLRCAIMLAIACFCQQALSWQDKQHVIAKNTTSNGHDVLDWYNSKSPTNGSMQPVSWVPDKSWFQERADRGCCPYAQRLYQSRYTPIEFRCCTSRLHQLEPLKPYGGVDFSFIKHLSLQKPISIVLQGDSLAEQHFLSMVCTAWYSDEPVELNATDEEEWKKTQWTATIGDYMTVSYIRSDVPRVENNINITEPDYLILGGWHHGGANAETLATFLDVLQTQRSKGTILVEALPAHFPGGAYKGNKPYPPATILGNRWGHGNDDDDVAAAVNISEQPVCNTRSLQGEPNINKVLVDLIRNRTGFAILKIEKLFHDRGAAHVGKIVGTKLGPQGRDCLHWCIAPGVVDAIALETLSMIVQRSSP